MNDENEDGLYVLDDVIGVKNSVVRKQCRDRGMKKGVLNLI